MAMMPAVLAWPPAEPTPSLRSGERMVFVYGTLRKGCANDIARFGPDVRALGQAHVRGRLYQLGWYPGLVLDAQAPWVRGELYAVSAEVEHRLDKLEEIKPTPESEYFRRLCRLGSSGPDCLVYEINPSRVQEATRIVSGDWLDCAL